MNTTWIRHTALAAAVLAVLTPSAAAHTDAAFATALAKPPAELATMAKLKTQTQQPPAAQLLGAGVDTIDWVNILHFVRNQGIYKAPAPGSKNSSYSVEEEIKDPRAEYTYMFITVSGEARGERLDNMLVLFNAMKTTATTTRVHADTWSFLADNMGRLMNASSSVIIKTADGKVTVSPDVELDINDPKVVARYAAIINYWAN